MKLATATAIAAPTTTTTTATTTTMTMRTTTMVNRTITMVVLVVADGGGDVTYVSCALGVFLDLQEYDLRVLMVTIGMMMRMKMPMR